MNGYLGNYLNQALLQNTLTAATSSNLSAYIQLPQWNQLSQIVHGYGMVSPSPAGKPPEPTNVEWLRKRVDEMRVRL